MIKIYKMCIIFNTYTAHVCCMCVVLQDIHLTIDDFYDVQSELWRARQKWYNLGVRLGISIDELEVINQKSSVESKLNAVIISWLNKGNNCTWKSICDALRHHTVAMEALANKIGVNIKIFSD